MEIEGFSEDQIVALVEMWQLGTPIDVMAFMDREDIPEDVKKRVAEAGRGAALSMQEQADKYRQMQAAIIMEVANLDKQRWNPFGGKGA